MKDFLLKISYKIFISNVDHDKILQDAEEIENNANQLINFTNIIKKIVLRLNLMIIEHLWKIIISDNNVDQYETNLMREFVVLFIFQIS